jgi:hypothetical protein
MVIGSPPGVERFQTEGEECGLARGQRFVMITWISPTSSVRSWDRFSGIVPDLP